MDAEREFVDVGSLTTEIFLFISNRFSGFCGGLGRCLPKMRILGSGTPRLKRDLGYGYSRMIVSALISRCCPLHDRHRRSWSRWSRCTNLILAVAVATCRTTSHGNGIECSLSEVEEGKLRGVREYDRVRWRRVSLCVTHGPSGILDL